MFLGLHTVLKKMGEHVVYMGRDLEAMSFAENYHRWILQVFEPYLGERLVEVGAGTGEFSKLILAREFKSVSLVEPLKAMFRVLSERLSHVCGPPLVNTYNSVFAEVAGHIREAQRPDSIIYVNVMEHIADDLEELVIVQRTLCERGRAFIFVPALRWLFGSFDHQVGHHRRYTKVELEHKCLGSGLRVIKSGYFDFIGIVPWWVKYCLFRSQTLGADAVRFYDRCIVPGAKLIESVVIPPVGKNIFLIAEKV